MNEKINVGGYQMINLEDANLASGAVIKGIFKLITATEKPILLSSMRFEQTTLKPQFANFWHAENENQWISNVYTASPTNDHYILTVDNLDNVKITKSAVV